VYWTVAAIDAPLWSAPVVPGVAMQFENPLGQLARSVKFASSPCAVVFATVNPFDPVTPRATLVVTLGGVTVAPAATMLRMS
jgi:hypothetical protein